MSEESKNSVMSWLTNPAFGWLALVLTIVVSIVVNEIMKIVDWQMLVVIGSAVFICFTLVSWVIVRYHAAPLGRFQKDLMDRFNYWKAPGIIEWLLTTEQMVEVEEKTEAPEIWVVSPDILEDLPTEKEEHGGHFCEVVKKNLSKGTKYKYFMPDTEGMKTKARELKAFHKDSDKLSVELLREGWFFFMVAGLDVTIYDPLTKISTRPTMYLGIPNQDGDRGQYQVRTNRDFTAIVVSKLENALKQNQSV